MRLKAISLESGLSKPEALSAFAVRDDLSKALLDKDLQGRSITVGYLSRFFKQTIRYLYGCLHISLYTILYGNMSSRKIGAPVPFRGIRPPSAGYGHSRPKLTDYRWLW
jgi:hypothetical protein